VPVKANQARVKTRWRLIFRHLDSNFDSDLQKEDSDLD